MVSNIVATAEVRVAPKFLPSGAPRSLSSMSHPQKTELFQKTNGAVTRKVPKLIEGITNKCRNTLFFSSFPTVLGLGIPAGRKENVGSKRARSSIVARAVLEPFFRDTHMGSFVGAHFSLCLKKQSLGGVYRRSSSEEPQDTLGASLIWQTCSWHK